MKTLKKYLIFCLISVVVFLIPAISKADTFKNVEWKYTEDAAKFPNENVDLLNNLYEYINDRTFYTTYSSYKVDKNAVVWDFHHLNENYIVGVFILPTFENSSLIYASYVNRSSNKDYNIKLYRENYELIGNLLEERGIIICIILINLIKFILILVLLH